MSLHPQGPGPIPEETVRVARSICPKGDLYMQIRDQLGAIYEDHSFAHLFAARGHPAIAPWQLALVSVFQFMEGLSDRQAAEAVRQRIDWKYALGLELTDPGFDFSVLGQFRSRLIAGGAEMQLFEVLLDQLKTRGLRHPLGGSNARTRRMSWRRFACSIDSSALERPYAILWARLPRSLPIGFVPVPHQSGTNAMAAACRIIVFPKPTRHETPLERRWERTASPC
jgi:transposase